MDRYIIVSPCYNEENVISIFLSELETIFSKTNYSFLVIMVNDCSLDSTINILNNFRFKSNNYELKVLDLKYNIGHQGAIKQGLIYASKFNALGYIVMDSDGEDNPEAIIKMIEMKSFEIIFVSRGKRKESFSFKVGYFLYKILFKIISGNSINFGNYSIINKTVLNAIIRQDFDHYSAFLSKLKFNKLFIKSDRRKRIDGKSKMKLSNLVFHGLNSLIEYSEELLFFFIRILLFVVLLFIIFGGYVVYSILLSNTAIPGWASTMAMSLINSILIISGIIVLGLLLVSNRNRNNYKYDHYSNEN